MSNEGGLPVGTRCAHVVAIEGVYDMLTPHGMVHLWPALTEDLEELIIERDEARYQAERWRSMAATLRGMVEHDSSPGIQADIKQKILLNNKFIWEIQND